MDAKRSEDVAPLPVFLAQPTLALSIVSQIPAGLLLVDISSSRYPIVYCNSAFFDLTGCLMDEVIGMPALDCFGQLGDAELADMLLLHFLSQRGCHTEFVSRCKRGTIMRCELSITPVLGSSRITHMLFLIQAATSWT